MSNVLTALQSTLFASARIVPTLMTGLVAAADRDFNDQGVQKGGTVKVNVMPKMTAGTPPAPSMTFPMGADRTATTIDFALNQEAEVTWNMTAEDERQLLISGQAQESLRQTLEQGWGSLRQQIDAYLGVVGKNSASRALATAGTTPFGSNTDVLVDARISLNRNGVAEAPRRFVMDFDASGNYGKLSSLLKVNEAGSDELLRNGAMGKLQGFFLSDSANIAYHTKGTMTGALVNSGALVVGSTTIPYDTGTPGATGIVAGDVISIAGDSNKYVVKTGPGAAASGNIVIQEPGLLVAPADNAAITVENSYRANLALGPGALKLVARPMLHAAGAHIEQMTIADEKTKLACNLIRVAGDRVTSWFMRMTYDAFSPNPYAINIVRG